jgi:hypothetical protein
MRRNREQKSKYTRKPLPWIPMRYGRSCTPKADLRYYQTGKRSNRLTLANRRRFYLESTRTIFKISSGANLTKLSGSCFRLCTDLRTGTRRFRFNRLHFQGGQPVSRRAKQPALLRTLKQQIILKLCPRLPVDDSETLSIAPPCTETNK